MNCMGLPLSGKRIKSKERDKELPRLMKDLGWESENWRQFKFGWFHGLSLSFFVQRKKESRKETEWEKWSGRLLTAYWPFSNSRAATFYIANLRHRSPVADCQVAMYIIIVISFWLLTFIFILIFLNLFLNKKKNLTYIIFHFRYFVNF